jgi:hypothetical protein
MDEGKLEQARKLIVGRVSAKELTEFIRDNIDPTCKSICATCPTQVRFAQARVKIWINKNK